MGRGGKLIAFYRGKLGWIQTQLGDKLGYSTPTISRIENGDILLSDGELIQFANALHCSPQVLINAFDVDREAKEGIYLQLTSQEIIDEAEASISYAHELRLFVNAQNARRLLASNIRRLRYIFNLERHQRPEIAKKVAETLSKGLLEEMLCYSTYCKRSEIVDVTIPDYAELSYISDFLGDKRLEHLAAAWLADSYYVAHRSKEAVTQAQRLASESKEPMVLYTALRTLMLGYAYLKGKDTQAKEKFEEYESQALNLVESKASSTKTRIERPTEQIVLFEAMGRGRALLKLSNAMDKLDTAEAISKSVESPVRILQVLRSRLVAFSTLDHLDYDQAVDTAQQALDLATKHKYERHIG